MKLNISTKLLSEQQEGLFKVVIGLGQDIIVPVEHIFVGDPTTIATLSGKEFCTPHHPFRPTNRIKLKAIKYIIIILL